MPFFKQVVEEDKKKLIFNFYHCCNGQIVTEILDNCRKKL